MTQPRINQTEYVRIAIERNDPELLREHLSVRQRRFVEEYLVDFNGTAAAIRAGYATKYADRQAHLLLKHPGVSALIDMQSRSKAAQIVSVDPDYVIARITAIIDKDEAKDSDKLRGLELIARHLKMLTDKQEISGPDGGAIELQQKAREDSAAVIAALRRMGKKPDLKVVND